MKHMRAFILDLCDWIAEGYSDQEFPAGNHVVWSAFAVRHHTGCRVSTALLGPDRHPCGRIETGHLMTSRTFVESPA